MYGIRTFVLKTHFEYHEKWVTIQAQAEGLDLVVESEAVQISDEEELQRVADKYNAKYSQPFNFTVRDGDFKNIRSDKRLRSLDEATDQIKPDIIVVGFTKEELEGRKTDHIGACLDIRSSGLFE